jgi:hypothetical protein
MFTKMGNNIISGVSIEGGLNNDKSISKDEKFQLNNI